MASSSAPRVSPSRELTEDEFLTDLVCFSTRTTRRMSFPSPTPTRARVPSHLAWVPSISRSARLTTLSILGFLNHPRLPSCRPTADTVRPRGDAVRPDRHVANDHPRVSSSTRRAARPAPISPDGTSFHPVSLPSEYIDPSRSRQLGLLHRAPRTLRPRADPRWFPPREP